MQMLGTREESIGVDWMGLHKWGAREGAGRGWCVGNNRISRCEEVITYWGGRKALCRWPKTISSNALPCAAATLLSNSKCTNDIWETDNESIH